MAASELKKPVHSKKEEIKEDIKTLLPEDVRIILYLQKLYPKLPTESTDHYKKLWPYHYRINFYREENKEKTVGFQVLKMTRSFFIIIRLLDNGLFEILKSFNN
jgi:hypothetical protein